MAMPAIEPPPTPSLASRLFWTLVPAVVLALGGPLVTLPGLDRNALTAALARGRTHRPAALTPAARQP